MSNKLTSGEVHIWPVDLTSLSLETDAQTYYHTLSAEEVRRADCFKFAEHRQRFIVVRGLLRRLLAGYLEMEPAEISINYTDKGKPILLGVNLEFNLSHTEHYAVYALTRDNAIGVDIEFIKPRVKILTIAERFFTANEYGMLKALPKRDQTKAFYCLWACKEAFVKALGEGVFHSFKQFEVDIVTKPIRLMGVEGSWHLASLDLWSDCAGAVVVNGLIERMHYLSV